MHYDQNIFRPPTEAYTLLLQVTSGCSNNSCTYCNMYRDVKFKVSPLKDIESDLIEASKSMPTVDRIYLLNGDPFMLGFDKLETIALLIKKYLPQCKTISMYASINNIKSKTLSELKKLRALGINQLYIGLETGHDETLKKINKGNTSVEARVELTKLNKAGIEFVTLIMYGIAGKGKGIENAKATAAILNDVNTIGIGPMNLDVIPETPLYSEVKNGLFEEADNIEKLLELKTFIESYNPQVDTLFSSMHISNLLTLNGNLPKDKEKFIEELETVIESVKENKVKFGERKFS